MFNEENENPFAFSSSAFIVMFLSPNLKKQPVSLPSYHSYIIYFLPLGKKRSDWTSWLYMPFPLWQENTATFIAHSLGVNTLYHLSPSLSFAYCVIKPQVQKEPEKPGLFKKTAINLFKWIQFRWKLKGKN